MSFRDRGAVRGHQGVRGIRSSSNSALPKAKPKVKNNLLANDKIQCGGSSSHVAAAHKQKTASFKRKSRAPQQPWDDSVNDLGAYRLSEKEILQRRLQRSSSERVTEMTDIQTMRNVYDKPYSTSLHNMIKQQKKVIEDLMKESRDTLFDLDTSPKQNPDKRASFSHQREAVLAVPTNVTSNIADEEPGTPKQQKTKLVLNGTDDIKRVKISPKKQAGISGLCSLSDLESELNQLKLELNICLSPMKNQSSVKQLFPENRRDEPTNSNQANFTLSNFAVELIAMMRKLTSKYNKVCRKLQEEEEARRNLEKEIANQKEILLKVSAEMLNQQVTLSQFMSMVAATPPSSSTFIQQSDSSDLFTSDKGLNQDTKVNQAGLYNNINSLSELKAPNSQRITGFYSSSSNPQVNPLRCVAETEMSNSSMPRQLFHQKTKKSVEDLAQLQPMYRSITNQENSSCSQVLQAVALAEPKQLDVSKYKPLHSQRQQLRSSSHIFWKSPTHADNHLLPSPEFSPIKDFPD